MTGCDCDDCTTWLGCDSADVEPGADNGPTMTSRRAELEDRYGIDELRGWDEVTSGRETEEASDERCDD